MGEIVPIPTLHLFAVLNKLLIDLLRSLTPDEWNKPTIAPLWTVKDIAAHLLDTNMRSISSAQGYSGKAPQNINSYRDLVNYLNELNAVWVKAMDRVSPQQLIDLLEQSNNGYVKYFSSLDPFATAKFSVAWAGEEQSLNWFHIAREYTEKWHHQQQIREAVNKPGLMTQELFYPCVATFVRGLPHTFRDVNAGTGTNIKINIGGEIGGIWYLQKNKNGWLLTDDEIKTQADAEVVINADTSWKLFTKGIKPAVAIEKSALSGNLTLAENVFNLVAVIA